MQDPSLLFRKLTDAEKDEIQRDFDIESSQDKFFSADIYVKDTYGPVRAKFYQMIRKDLSDNLDIPLDFPDIERMIDTWEGWNNCTGMALSVITEYWISSKLISDAGFPLTEKNANNAKSYDHIDSYAWAMMKLYCYISSGVTGLINIAMDELIQYWEKEGYDFTDEETFFRLAYSLLEFAGIYRPLDLIERRIHI
jgi:hypothetical protein